VVERNEESAFKSSWHVATAAEAIVAGQFARLDLMYLSSIEPEYELDRNNLSRRSK
jgi:hypothetical protein